MKSIDWERAKTMNREYIEYIEQLLDTAEKNDTFNLTSREFTEFSLSVSLSLELQTPLKPTYDHQYGEMGCAFCGNMVSGWEELPNYCPQCGQAIDWMKE
jgi:hypothetical protein